MGWLTGWEYRKPVTVDNTGNSNTHTDYPVLITTDTQALVNAGKMQADGDDIRLTDDDGTTLLKHWVEGGINTTSTKLWAKVPSIPGSQSKTIYLYYGKADALNAEDPINVFTYFNPMDAATGLETSYASFSGGICTIDPPGSGSQPAGYVRRVTSIGQDYALRVRANWANEYGAWKNQQFGWFSGTGTNNDYGATGGTNAPGVYAYIQWDTGVRKFGTWTASAGTTTDIGDDWRGSYNVLEVRFKSGKAQFALNDVLKATHTTNVPSGPYNQQIGVYQATGALTQLIDWFLIRKWSDPDPLTSLGSEEGAFDGDLVYHLSGGSTNTDPNASLGGAISSTLVADNSLNNLFDDIAEDECLDGDAEYRAVFVKNPSDKTDTVHGVKVWILAQPDAGRDFKEEVYIGVEAPSGGSIQTIPNESTPPSGITFSQPSSEAEGLSIGDLAPGACYGIWIKRIFPAKTITNATPASFQIRSEDEVGKSLTLKYNVPKVFYHFAQTVLNGRDQAYDILETCPALILAQWGSRWTFPNFIRSPEYDVVDPPPSWPSTQTKQMEQVYDKTIKNLPWVNLSPWEQRRDQGLVVDKWGSGVRLTNLRYKISGVTRDQNGLPLGYCTVQLIAKDTLTVAQETTSDGNGNYTFHIPDPDQEYFVRAFKAGTPDRWGTTEHTLKGQAA